MVAQNCPDTQLLLLGRPDCSEIRLHATPDVDKGRLQDASSRHAYVVARNEEKKTAFVLGPLMLRPTVTLCPQLRGTGDKVHKIKREWSPKIAHAHNCSYLATQITAKFLCTPPQT